MASRDDLILILFLTIVTGGLYFVGMSLAG